MASYPRFDPPASRRGVMVKNHKKTAGVGDAVLGVPMVLPTNSPSAAPNRAASDGGNGERLSERKARVSLAAQRWPAVRESA